MIEKKQKNGDSSKDLVKTWRENRPFFDGLKFRQIVSIAGDGELGDNKESSRQLRAFLGEVPLPYLRRYAEECLAEKDKKRFPNKGFALQDVVNQVGRRLGFEVEDGRYQGVKNALGHDGVWRLPNGRTIVVEVKTTDTYSISLDILAEYRQKVIESSNLPDKIVSVLLVVGRNDTGGLEAQIRGSRHAWDMRVIGVDALLKIAEIKECVEEPNFKRIHEVLIPKEFTRLDEIAELVLSTATDSSANDEPIEDDEESEQGGDNPVKESATPVPAQTVAKKQKNSGSRKPLSPFHTECIARVESELKSRKEISADLIRQGRSTFATPGDQCRVVLITSKNYLFRDRQFFFGLQAHQKDFLRACKRGWLALCGDSGEGGTVFLIPWGEFSAWESKLRPTKKNPGGSYLEILEESSDSLMLSTRPSFEDVNLSRYIIGTNNEA